MTACEDFVPVLGAEINGACIDVDYDPSTEVSFKTDILLGLFQQPLGTSGQGTCLPCHDPLGEDSEGYQEGGLDLTSHAALMAGGVNSLEAIVVPGKPCESWLWLKATGAPPSGSPMPFEEQPLSTEQSNLIHDWIAEGARDN